MSNTTKRVKEIRRNARRKFSSEEKIRIVLDGLRGESSIAEMDVFESTGGSFDDPLPPGTTKIGSMNIDFTDCSNALLSYSLPADPVEGDIAITGVIPGGRALCEELAGAD
jgi:hypothetical protein